MHGRAIAVAGVAAAAVILAATATAGPTARTVPRIVLYAVTVDGRQSTTWTSHATMKWCPSASQRLAFEGQGRQDLTFHSKGPVLTPMLVGGSPTTAQRVTVTAGGQRQATLVAHYAALTDRPAECDPLPAVDTSAPASDCGAVTPELTSAIVLRGHAFLATTGGVDDRGDCPWLGTAFDDDGSLQSVEPGIDHPDGAGAILPLDLTGAPAPRPPFHPATARLHDSKQWHISFEGGRIDVTSTIDATVRIVLKPTVVPGIGIAGVRIGELVSRLRPDYPFAHSDSGLSHDRTLQWEIQVLMPFPSPRPGEREEISGVATAPARGTAPLYDRPFSPMARVTSLTAGSTLEVTAEGIGWGSTLAELRRSHRGHLWTRRAPNGAAQEWVIDGPGRRITALPIFQGVVGPPTIGCRAPANLFNRVLDNVRC